MQYFGKQTKIIIISEEKQKLSLAVIVNAMLSMCVPKT